MNLCSPRVQTSWDLPYMFLYKTHQACVQQWKTTLRATNFHTPHLPMASNTPQMNSEHKIAIEDDLGERLDRVQRGQWLRAAILGSNDGLLSTTSLMLGMAAVTEDRWDMMLSGVAAAVAGACSMAVGEYVSVATQRDIEEMDYRKNKESQPVHPPEIFRLQLVPSPAVSVASDKGSLKVREEVKEERLEALPNPLKASAASAIAFLFGAIIPLLSAMFIADHRMRILMLVIVTTLALAAFGGLGAYLGGSRVSVSAMRVLVGGCISMGVTYGLLKPLHGFDGEG